MAGRGAGMSPQTSPSTATATPEIEEMRAYCEKITAWLEKAANNAEKQAKGCDRFPGLQKSLMADAKNYRAMATDGKKAIAAYGAWVTRRKEVLTANESPTKSVKNG